MPKDPRPFSLFPYSLRPDARVMTFVDGENLAIRFGAELAAKDLTAAPDHVIYEKDIYVWSRFASLIGPHDHVRHYYYTSASGDDPKRRDFERLLANAGIEEAHVFPRTKDKGSKRVDITLASTMLSHAHRKNFDVAVLVAGDEDYIPLVEAVKAEGCRVYLWFVESGLSPALRARVDYFCGLSDLFLSPTHEVAAVMAGYSWGNK
jgi:uncharacterized LabA/DUF88 family protein